MFTALDLLIVMGFAWMISGVILLASGSGRRERVSRYAMVTLLVFGLTLADNFLRPAMFGSGVLTPILVVGRNSYFLIGPALWFYTRALLDPDKGLGPLDLLHLVPFVLGCLLFVVSPDLITLPPPGANGPIPPPPGGLSFARDLAAIVARIAYSVLVLRRIAKHAGTATDFYSNLSRWNTLSWLSFLVVIYAVLFLGNASVMLVPVGGAERLRGWVTTNARIVPALLFVFLFAHMARNQGVPEDRTVVLQADGVEPAKYTRSGLTRAEAEEVFERLAFHVTENKPYLDPDLTLDTLARNLGESRHRVSEAINRQTGESFYAYVNSFRVREFLAALREERYPDYTILAVAFECGFKSASTFYSLFRKSTGQTPREYLKAPAEAS